MSSFQVTSAEFEYMNVFNSGYKILKKRAVPLLLSQFF